MDSIVITTFNASPGFATNVKAFAASLRGKRCVITVSGRMRPDRKSTRLNSSHGYISYAVFCLKKKNFLLDPALCSRELHQAQPVHGSLRQTLHPASLPEAVLHACLVFIGMHTISPSRELALPT